MQQVFPSVREAPISEIYDDPRRRRRESRPWIIMSMISSADGAVSIEGVSGGLGGNADRSVFRHLRSIADGVVVGAQTVRAERYSPLPSRQTLVVVSRTGNLGDSSQVLHDAGNTLVTSGGAKDICSRLDGDVWILEGGPSLNAQMLAADCVDEVCLTIAPSLVARETGRIVQGDVAASGSWELSLIAHDTGYVFLRYVRNHTN